jgi:hypothetical protein
MKYNNVEGTFVEIAGVYLVDKAGRMFIETIVKQGSSMVKEQLQMLVGAAAGAKVAGGAKAAGGAKVALGAKAAGGAKVALGAKAGLLAVAGKAKVAAATAAVSPLALGLVATSCILYCSLCLDQYLFKQEQRAKLEAFLKKLNSGDVGVLHSLVNKADLKEVLVDIIHVDDSMKKCYFNTQSYTTISVKTSNIHKVLGVPHKPVPGDLVLLKDLDKVDGLNGVVAYVCKYHKEKDRFEVKIQVDGKPIKKLVKASNMQKLLEVDDSHKSSCVFGESSLVMHIIVFLVLSCVIGFGIIVFFVLSLASFIFHQQKNEGNLVMLHSLKTNNEDLHGCVGRIIPGQTCKEEFKVEVLNTNLKSCDRMKLSRFVAVRGTGPADENGNYGKVAVIVENDEAITLDLSEI